MKKKTFTTQYGRVPGTGEQHTHTSYRPEGNVFARKQITDMLHLSNVKVVSAAINHLEIEPISYGFSTRETYKNGGFGIRNFSTEYFDKGAIERIQSEIFSNSESTEFRGKYKYRGITFTSYDES